MATVHRFSNACLTFQLDGLKKKRLGGCIPLSLNTEAITGCFMMSCFTQHVHWNQDASLANHLGVLSLIIQKQTDTTVNSPAIKQVKRISLHYHLFELWNSKQDWVFISKSAVCDVCAYESWVRVPISDIWTDLRQREWRSRGIERLHHLFRQQNSMHFSLDGLISYRDSWFLLMKDKLEIMAQVSKLEQHSTRLVSLGLWQRRS